MICEIICIDGFLCMSHLDIVHILSAYVHVICILSDHMHIIDTTQCIYYVHLISTAVIYICTCHAHII